MATVETYVDGVLRERWDDGSRTFTAWGATGVVVAGTPRPYTAAENARADVTAAGAVAETNRRTIGQMLDQDFIDVQGVLAQTNAELRNDPSQEIKIIGRVVRRLIRETRGDFSGTD